jgi:hypothetical protein
MEKEYKEYKEEEEEEETLSSVSLIAKKGPEDFWSSSESDAEVEWMDAHKEMPPVKQKSCFCCTKIFAPKNKYYSPESVVKS